MSNAYRKRMRLAQKRMSKGLPCLDCGAQPFRQRSSTGYVVRHTTDCPVREFWEPRSPVPSEMSD